MRETRYDLMTSFVIATALLLAGTVILLIAVWLTNLLPEPSTLGVQMLSGEGGFEDGLPDQTLLVESPEDPSDDPSLSNDQQETQVEQILDKVISATGEASQLKLPNLYTHAFSGGNPGSADGTGGRPLGSGGPGQGGLKWEQRWYVEFAERGDLQSYAQQLDFFGIELGITFRNGRVVYLRHLSTSAVRRDSRADVGDQRLFMNWQGGKRIEADRELLARAGVSDITSGTILHFYPAETENMLIQLEREFAGQSPDKIRRTNFKVVSSENEFRFVVTSQKYR